MYQAAAWARFPAASMFPCLYFIQPVTTSAIVCLSYGEGGTIAIGLGGLIFVAAYIAATVYFFVRRLTGCCRYVDLTAEASATCVLMIFGRRGDWVDVDPKAKMTRQFGALFDDYTNQAPWFIVIELAVSVLLGIAMALKVVGCPGLSFVAVAIYIGYVVALVHLRPHARPFDLAFTVLLAVAQLLTACLIVVQLNGTWSEGQQSGIEIVSVVTMFLMLLRAAYDVFATISDLFCQTLRSRFVTRRVERTRLEAQLLENESITMLDVGDSLHSPGPAVAMEDKGPTPVDEIDADLDKMLREAEAPPPAAKRGDGGNGGSAPPPPPPAPTPARRQQAPSWDRPVDYSVRLPSAFYMGTSDYQDGARPLLDIELTRQQASPAAAPAVARTQSPRLHSSFGTPRSGPARPMTMPATDPLDDFLSSLGAPAHTTRRDEDIDLDIL
jgi:hypothetical protein